MSVKKSPYFNASGYPDPTAFYGSKEVVKEERELDKKVHDLVNVLKFIVNLAGFEFIGRIRLRHKESKKEFK